MQEHWNAYEVRLGEEFPASSGTWNHWRCPLANINVGDELTFNPPPRSYYGVYEGPHTLKFTLESEDEDGLHFHALTQGEDREVEFVLKDLYDKCEVQYEHEGRKYHLSVVLGKRTYTTSELPPEVRTMQQIDHDAWEYAARNGLLH